MICVWLCLVLLPLSSALSAGRRVFDEANLFTPAQVEALELAIADFQNKTDRAGQKMDFVIVTSRTAHNKSTEAMADDFYDYGGYGFDEQHSGVLYYLDMAERYQHLSTTGLMINIMTDARIQSAIDACTSDLTSGRYASAVETMIRRVESAIGIKELTMAEIIVSAVISLVVCVIITTTTTRRYQLKGSTYNYQYRSNAEVQMTEANDAFLRTTTTRMPKPPPSSGSGSSGGGGSSVHTGSSGTSHGGGGGRF